jgi:hypothetical protein
LLELARLQSTTEPPAVEAIDLTDTIASAVDAMPAPVRNRLQIKIAPGTPLVASNAVMLHHITMNLIDNAAKYSPHDSGIGVCVTDDGTGGAILSVIDSGTGLVTMPRICLACSGAAGMPTARQDRVLGLPWLMRLRARLGMTSPCRTGPTVAGRSLPSP